MPTVDVFDQAYGTGVDRLIPRQRSRGSHRRPIMPPQRAPLGAMPTQAVAFGGSVIGPTGSLARGWVVVADGAIVEVRSTKPRDALPIATGGVILPGLIDLHGHPEYNVFAAWEPPRVYINRGAWRGSREYDALIKKPWSALTSGGTATSVKTAMTRYAETRAVVGGVTAIQGASQDYPKKAEALVRNVDLVVFGQQIARSTVDVDRLAPDRVASIASGIADGSVKAHYVHLAEGQQTNATSVNEFVEFANSPMFGPATVVIHGTALQRVHFDHLAAAGGKLVWSPQSNLRLYDQTTNVKAALDAGVPVALGADWMPSGSPNLLHELKIAERVLAEQNAGLAAADLVDMVTAGAARIAGLAQHLGSLQAGRPADLVVLQRERDDPYDNVVAAYPSWVDLVMVGGDIVYGRPDWVQATTGASADYERVEAWGRHMLLDTRFGSPDDAATPTPGPPRRLAQMRQRLIDRYPALGPIFA